MTPQTLSGQIKLLEGRLGCALFAKSGRRLELTPAGRTALRYAEQIFALGEDLKAAMDAASGAGDRLDFRVGVSDSVPKAIAYRLIEPALDVAQPVRLICHEGQFDDLLGRLAGHKLDLVLADEPMRREMSVQRLQPCLGRQRADLLRDAGAEGDAAARISENLNKRRCCCATYAGIRGRFERWCSAEDIHVNVVAELDDSALITAFGREGRGVFMAPRVLERDTCNQNGVVVLGRTEDLLEEFFAISVERRITHPCVESITQSARDRLFQSEARGAG